MKKITIIGFLFLCFITDGIAQSVSVSYQYDALNRVEKAIYSNGTEVTYRYDEVNNRIKRTVKKAALSVTPTELTIAVEASSTAKFTVKTISSVAWTITEVPAWLSVSQTSGMGEVEITLTAEENSTANQRTATLLVKSDGLEDHEVQVTQSSLQNQLPIANAGTNQIVESGVEVTLDASASTDPDGDELIYKWIVPNGIVLNDVAAVNPVFTAPIVTTPKEYLFTLIVNDGKINSQPATVLVTVNPEGYVSMPVANAGQNQSVLAGETVTLDGSASTAPNNETLTYQWTGPSGITLSADNIAKPTFVAPNVSTSQDYKFALTVSDGNNISEVSEVWVTVNSSSLGVPNITVEFDNPEFEEIKLSVYLPSEGMVKIDWGDGNLQTYNVEEVGYTGEYWIAPVFTPSESNFIVKIYNDDITEFDCRSQNVKNIVFSNCNNLTDLDCAKNKINNLQINTLPQLKRLECERNELLTLDITGLPNLEHLNCTYNKLTTLDTSNNAELTYLHCWFNDIVSLDLSNNILLDNLDCSKNNLTELNVSNCTQLRTLICSTNKLERLDVSNNTALLDLYCFENEFSTCSFDDLYASLPVFDSGTHRIFLVRKDVINNNALMSKTELATNKGWQPKYYDRTGTRPDFIGDGTGCVNSNNRPVANAGIEQIVEGGNTVTLDGSFSLDADGDELTYHWTAPSGITLSNANIVQPVFTAPILSSDTNYVFTLIVNDGQLDSKQVSTVVTVKSTTNTVPVANAGGNQIVDSDAVVILDASASSDPDGDTLTYMWTSPAQITLSNANAEKPTFVAPKVNSDTNYTFTLVVSDGLLHSNQASVVVTVLANNDEAVPTVVTQDITVELDANGQAIISSNQIDNGSSDNITSAENLSFSVSSSSFDCSNLGVNEVTLTVTDEAGNSSTGLATVTVVDNTAPVLAVQDVTLDLNGSSSVSLTGSQVVVSVSDNCSSTNVNLSQITFTSEGVYEVNITTIDGSGNVTSADVEVTVINTVDSTLPVVVTQDITVELDASGQAIISSDQIDNGSSDNVTSAENLSFSISPSSFDCSNLGVNEVTLTVTDEAGNSSIGLATVTVVDNMMPVVEFAESINLSILDTGSVMLEENQVVLSVIDNCDSITINLSQNEFTESGEYVVNVIVSDVNGNQTLGQVNVTVVNSLGLNDVVNDELNIYPNPTEDILFVESKSSISIVEIYDLLGKRITLYEGSLDKIDLRHFSQGTYLIKIYIGDKVYSKKVIKK